MTSFHPNTTIANLIQNGVALTAEQYATRKQHLLRKARNAQVAETPANTLRAKFFGSPSSDARRSATNGLRKLNKAYGSSFAN